MSARSLLFVPGDSDRKLAKGEQIGADILILDLEDAVAPDAKAGARVRVAEYLAARRERPGSQLWVRINPLDTPEALKDLALVVKSAPDGIVQPKTRSPKDLERLGHHLDVLEVEHGIERGRIRIVPVATETAEAMFSLGDYRSSGPRLYGITWGAEDLGAALGVMTNKTPDGAWTRPFEIARTLCLYAAHAAGVPAIDTVYTDIRNTQGLRASCAESRRDGFTGRIAIHPDQVPIINETFMPSAEEVGHAQAIIALFAANPGVAALTLEGQMVDIPHLKQAEKLLARAKLTRR